MLLYLAKGEHDEELVVVSEGNIGLHVSSLHHILEILKKFPLRRYDAQSIFSVARYELSAGDKETMIVFGWNDTENGWWHPFLRITLTEAVVADGKVLWEKVLQESLKTEHVKRRVAIGCD